MEVDIPSLFVRIIRAGIFGGYVIRMIVSPALRDRDTGWAIYVEKYVRLSDTGMKTQRSHRVLCKTW